MNKLLSGLCLDHHNISTLFSFNHFVVDLPLCKLLYSFVSWTASDVGNIFDCRRLSHRMVIMFDSETQRCPSPLGVE